MTKAIGSMKEECANGFKVVLKKREISLGNPEILFHMPFLIQPYSGLRKKNYSVLESNWLQFSCLQYISGFLTISVADKVNLAKKVYW